MGQKQFLGVWNAEWMVTGSWHNFGTARRPNFGEAGFLNGHSGIRVLRVPKGTAVPPGKYHRKKIRRDMVANLTDLFICPDCGSVYDYEATEQALAEQLLINSDYLVCEDCNLKKKASAKALGKDYYAREEVR